MITLALILAPISTLTLIANVIRLNHLLREARVECAAARRYAQTVEHELFLVRGISGALFGERTSAAVRRLLVKARGRDAQKVWS
jgi:hypothetical protein